jgi:hypothetical protein
MVRVVLAAMLCIGCNASLPPNGADASTHDSHVGSTDGRDNGIDAAEHAIDSPNDGIDVTWGTGCWYTDSGHRYQAMSFQLTTTNPVPLEGTLYYTTNCDPGAGTDNLNDNGNTIPSGGWTFWFIHHPDNLTTSAIWSMGSLGDHPSVCIDYSTAPSC